VRWMGLSVIAGSARAIQSRRPTWRDGMTSRDEVLPYQVKVSSESSE
jgi:hypothetical protein